MPVNLTGPRNAISVDLAAGGSASLACGLGLAVITSIAPAVLDSLFPSGLSVGPAVGTPALSQTHVLAPVGLTVAPTVEFPARYLKRTRLRPPGLSVEPAVGSPAMTSGSAFAVDGLTVAPVLNSPALSQTHALAPAGVQTVPAFGAPVLTQTHTLAPTGLTVAPSLGTPSLGGALALTPAGLSMTSALGSPALSQVHALTPTGLPMVPTVGAPALTQTHALAPAGLTLSPTVGAPAVTQTHVLAPAGITATPSVGAPTVTTGGGAGFTLPASVVSAHSVARAVDSSYSGNLIRVRRSSDNAEADIGLDGSGNLDEAALLAHTGTGGTDHGYITTVYEQTGTTGAVNMAQTVSAKQPVIVDSGVVMKENGKPTAASPTSGSGQEFFNLANMTLLGQGLSQSGITVFMTCKVISPSLGLLLSAGQNFYFGVTQSGSGSSPQEGAFTPSYFHNNASSGTTRGALFSAWTTASLILLRVQGLALSNSVWGVSTRTNYVTTNESGPEALSELIFCEDPSSGDISEIESNRATYYGITLS